jgi:hypothetical protein
MSVGGLNGSRQGRYSYPSFSYISSFLIANSAKYLSSLASFLPIMESTISLEHSRSLMTLPSPRILSISLRNTSLNSAWSLCV